MESIIPYGSGIPIDMGDRKMGTYTATQLMAVKALASLEDTLHELHKLKMEVSEDNNVTPVKLETIVELLDAAGLVSRNDNQVSTKVNEVIFWAQEEYAGIEKAKPSLIDVTAQELTSNEYWEIKKVIGRHAKEVWDSIRHACKHGAITAKLLILFAIQDELRKLWNIAFDLSMEAEAKEKAIAAVKNREAHAKVRAAARLRGVF